MGGGCMGVGLGGGCMGVGLGGGCMGVGLGGWVHEGGHAGVLRTCVMKLILGTPRSRGPTVHMYHAAMKLYDAVWCATQQRRHKPHPFPRTCITHTCTTHMHTTETRIII